MTQCKTCDRREATDDEWRDMAAGEGSDLCWGEPGCSAHAVDWRERALAAERERDEARVLAETLAEQCRGLAATLAHTAEERNEARQALCSLLSGHLSPSDAVRQSAISAAVETRRGWGM